MAAVVVVVVSLLMCGERRLGYFLRGKGVVIVKRFDGFIRWIYKCCGIR